MVRCFEQLDDKFGASFLQLCDRHRLDPKSPCHRQTHPAPEKDDIAPNSAILNKT